MSLPTPKLSVWMDGKNATALRDLAVRWWGEVDGYLRLPLTTFDPLTCDIGFVDLLAYQRGIDRFMGESEAFYRLRVHHALRNAWAAGTTEGMQHIFTNLGLPPPRITERMVNRDWDVSRVTFYGRDYARMHAEIDFILQFYWRTCRRFDVHQEVFCRNKTGAGMIGHGRGVNVKNNEPSAVPFRPARSKTGAGIIGHGRGVNVKSVTSCHVPPRELTMTAHIGADNVLSLRSVNCRVFRA